MTERAAAMSAPATDWSADDHRLMARALVLARRGIGLTDPNPSVGCVIVRDGRIVGEGTTAAAGGPHAEIAALAQAGAGAAGADVYVTLEPCNHYGRTGPCTRALIEAGVARVVAALPDPDERMSGQGFAALAAAGIGVRHGCLAAGARKLNRGYFSRLERARPWTRLKIAASLDGRTALANGRSQWITGAEARADVHRWRARSSGVVTGIGTVLADDPMLTARPVEDFAFVPPLRVVVDSALRTPPSAKLFEAAGDVLIAAAGAADGDPAPLTARGAGIDVIPGGPRVDLARLSGRLAERGLNTLWIEAGATLAGAWLDAGLVDELVVYLAPDLLGAAARGMAEFGPLTDLADRLTLEIADVRRFGRDLRIIAAPATLPQR